MRKLHHLLSLVLLAGAVAASGCAFTLSHGASSSPAPPAQGRPIHVEVSDYGLFHLTFPDLVVTAGMRQQCPNGQISNVESELRMREWFLIVQDYTATATAVCISK